VPEFYSNNKKTKNSVIREIRAKKMKQEDLTSKIIACTYKVHNTLGFGFLETIYQNALLIELTKAGLHAEKEKRIKVFYNDQLINYLKAAGIEIGLLINFAESVQIKRKILSHP